MPTIKVRPIEESLDFILAYQPSVARFGDGEMDIVAGHGIPYQDYDETLASQLRHIMGQESSENFLVCLSDVFEGRERYNSNFSFFWDGHLERFGHLYEEICKAPWYGSTFISRPYIDLEDKSPATSSFAKLKQLWQDRDILIVEGATSRSGVGNDLFAQAKSVSRIICPSKNAYAHYDEIASAIRQYGKDKLVLLMLGPTAKVLSYNLSREGFWTIDLGHIDSEYEWFLMGATHKVKLHHKHTAEHNYDEGLVLEEDKNYNGQIVRRIGRERLAVAAATDDNYASHLGTLIYSFWKHHQSEDCEFYICHCGLTEETKERLSQISRCLSGLTITYLQVPEDSLAGLSMEGKQWTVETYLRLFLPDLLPMENRLIYLDVDTLVVDSLLPLWKMELGEHYFAGVGEELIHEVQQDYLRGIGIADGVRYINAGVLLMNLEKLRAEGWPSRLLSLAEQKGETLHFPDQDILNLVFQNQILLVDKKYNYHNDFLLSREYMAEDKTVIHYGGSRLTKPWTNQVLLFDYIKPAAAIYRAYREEYLQLLSSFYPKVTAVVLVGQGAEDGRHLREAVDSLLLQTYPNLEVVLLGHGERMEGILTMDHPRIQGVDTSLGTFDVVEFASNLTSDYVFFSHALDVVEKDCVWTLSHLAETTGQRIVLSDYYVFDPERGVMVYHKPWDARQLVQGKSDAWLTTLLGKFMSKDVVLQHKDWTHLVSHLLDGVEELPCSSKAEYLVRGQLEERSDLSTLVPTVAYPLVSILIPVYNVEQYLDECIQSALDQTYPNIEVVLVNDGSTDRSGEICDRYAAQDDRVRVYHKENGGASSAKNVAVSVARGEWVTILDSDDVLKDQGMVSILFENAQLHQADLAIGNYFEYDQNDGCFYYRNLDQDFIIETVTVQEAIDRQAHWRHLNTSAFVITAGKLIRRSLFEGIEFPEGRMFDDEFVTHKLYMKSKGIVLVNGNYYLYRRGHSSVMNSGYSLKRVQDIIFVFQEKIADLVLAGYDTTQTRLRYRNVLKDYHRVMAHYGLQESQEYRQIAHKIHLIEEKDKEAVHE